MNARESAMLDQHITGNYGADQFPDAEDDPDTVRMTEACIGAHHVACTIRTIAWWHGDDGQLTNRCVCPCHGGA